MLTSHAHNERERGVWGPRGKRNLHLLLCLVLFVALNNVTLFRKGFIRKFACGRSNDVQNSYLRR